MATPEVRSATPPPVTLNVSSDGLKDPTEAVVNKTTSVAEKAFLYLSCLASAYVSFSTLKPEVAIGNALLGGVVSYMLNGGDGFVLLTNKKVTPLDVLRHAIPTALAVFAPTTLPVSAAFTLIAFGNLAYRTLSDN
jgi:hypothetical protein